MNVYFFNLFLCSDDLKTRVKEELEELDDQIYDFQQEYPQSKAKHGFLRFHFHRINSLFYKKLFNLKKSLREQKLYLQFSMYAGENSNSFSRNESNGNLASESFNESSPPRNLVSENESNISVEIIDEENFANSNYESNLAALNDRNLYVLREIKFFKHFFDSCDERSIDLDLNFKSIQSYINFNNLKVRLKHFIKEDLIDMREKQEKIREFGLNTSEYEVSHDDIKKHINEINEDMDNLNKLEIEIDLAFSFYQRRFVLFALNCN